MADRSDTREARISEIRARAAANWYPAPPALYDVPWLIDRVAALEAERATLREALERIAEWDETVSSYDWREIARAALVSGETA